jgi:predicted O-methyltransferase YrrM
LKRNHIKIKISLDTIEIDEDRYLEAKANFKRLDLTNRVKQYLGDANDIIKYLDKQYDFIMLDGPKGHYYDMLYYLDRMLSVNGVIFADNVLFKGKVIGDNYPAHKHRTIVRELRAFNNRLTENNSYDTTLLNTGDGIIIATKIKM